MNTQIKDALKDVINQKFILKKEIIRLHEFNAQLRVQSSLGPEILNKLGHKADQLPILNPINDDNDDKLGVGFANLNIIGKDTKKVSHAEF
jgi:hypothetical protein